MAILASAIAAAATAARAQDAAVPDLAGRWDDGGRPVEIEQRGAAVTARFLEPPLCDPQDGSEPRPREVDFEGTLGAGDTLRGKAFVCNYGEDWGSDIGIQPVDMWLVPDPDGTELAGEYEGMNGWTGMSLTRAGCGLGSFPEEGPSGELVVTGIVEGFRSVGLDIGPEHVIAGRSNPATWTYMIRLDHENNILPSGDTILAAGEAGEIELGSQVGSEYVLLGMIQLWERGDRTRVGIRKVVTETGVVGETGKGDADGTDPCALAEAMAAALEASGISFGEPQGLAH